MSWGWEAGVTGGGGGMGGFEIDWYITSMKLWQSIAEGPLIISWGKERNK